MSDDAAPNPEPKQKRLIKIGSQRPGYVPDPPKRKERAPQPPPPPKKEKPKFRIAADPQASQGATEEPAVQDVVKTELEDASNESVAEVPTSTSSSETPAAAPAAVSVPAADDAPGEVPVPAAQEPVQDLSLIHI